MIATPTIAQQRQYEAMLAWQDEYGQPPTYRELAEVLGQAHNATVRRMPRLEALGLVERRGAFGSHRQWHALRRGVLGRLKRLYESTCESERKAFGKYLRQRK